MGAADELATMAAGAGSGAQRSGHRAIRGASRTCARTACRKRARVDACRCRRQSAAFLPALARLLLGRQAAIAPPPTLALEMARRAAQRTIGIRRSRRGGRRAGRAAAGGAL